MTDLVLVERKNKQTITFLYTGTLSCFTNAITADSASLCGTSSFGGDRTEMLHMSDVSEGEESEGQHDLGEDEVDTM